MTLQQLDELERRLQVAMATHLRQAADPSWRRFEAGLDVGVPVGSDADQKGMSSPPPSPARPPDSADDDR